MSKFSRENTASKLKGAGDGLKTLTNKPSERIPVPSSRKFTATMVRDESVQLKLKQVIDEIEAKGLKKSKTVAEITPTKSTRKNRLKRHDSRSSTILHATPRPPLSDVKKPPSGRVDTERRLQLLVYHRMLLFVWRRSKTRLAMVSESLRRRQDQISKLEKQIDCLKNLTQAECHKRGEAIGDCQRLESVLQSAQLENNALIAEKEVLQNEVKELQIKIEDLKLDKENMKNEIDTKNMCLRKLETDLETERIAATNLRDQNAALISKVKAQDAEIQAQEQSMDQLNRTLKEMEIHLLECQEQNRAQGLDLNKLSEQYKLASKKNSCLKQELSRVYLTKDKIKNKLVYLEENFVDMGNKYDLLLKENEALKEELDKKKCWWRNAKEIMIVSWTVLQNAAYIMLPAL